MIRLIYDLMITNALKITKNVTRETLYRFENFTFLSAYF